MIIDENTVMIPVIIKPIRVREFAIAVDHILINAFINFGISLNLVPSPRRRTNDVFMNYMYNHMK